MYSTINTYRNDTIHQDLALYVAERRLSRSADHRQPAQHARAARSLAATRQVAMALFAVFALLVALAVPVIAAPLI